MKRLEQLRRICGQLRLPSAGGPWLIASAAILITEVILSIVFWDWLTGADSAGATITGADSAGATLRNIGLVIAGSVALPLALWRGVVADKQASAAQRQADLGRETLLNERYQKAAEMLGSNVLTVRMGGIYALRQLAQDHDETYHLQVMSLFCAFVRRPPIDPEAAVPVGNGPPVLRQDVQAVVDAIAARTSLRRALERGVGYTLDLRGSNLAGVRIHGGMRLGGRSVLRVPEVLSVPGTNVDLEYGDIDLSHAQLEGAKLTYAWLIGADLSRADLEDANLSHALLLGANLSHADLQDANLSHAYLMDANLSDGAVLLGTNFAGASLQGADLTNGTFGDTDLSGAALYFEDVDGDSSPAKGITQAMLDRAVADPNNPPKLGGVLLDAETGEPLVWNGGIAPESP